jgi:hypothetical protein
MPLSEFAIRGGRVLFIVHTPCDTTVMRIANETRLDVIVVATQTHICPLPCGCVPHVTRMSPLGTALYCETEGQPYCNFECPHEEENDGPDGTA